MDKDLRKILVVDDDPDIGIMIKTVLEYHGYPVTVNNKAIEAENMLRTGSYRLLIMDMLLSGVNGIDVCTRIKNDPELSMIPVIMISAHPNAEKICQQAGAEGFVPKPFEMMDLISNIRRLLPGS